MKKSIICLLFLAIVLPAFAAGNNQAAANLTEIVVVGPSMGPVPRGLPEVQDEVNKIVAPLGIKVKFNIIETAAYPTNIPLMMASQEKMDLVLSNPRAATNFTAMLAQNMLMDITDIYAKYGSDIKSVVDNLFPGYLDATTLNGKLYGIPGIYNMVNNYYYFARGDIIDKYNLSFGNLKDMKDVEALLEQVKQLEPTLAPLVPNQNGHWAFTQQTGFYYPVSFANSIYIDTLGYADPLFVVLFSDPYKVLNWYKLDQVKQYFLYAHDLYTKGLVYKDGAIMQEMSEEIVKANKGFSWFINSEIGAETAKSAQTGYPIKAQLLYSSPVNNTNLKKFAWTVPVYSKNPIQAIQFLGKSLTSSEITNLLDWGIEGRDYVARPDGTIGYPSGVNAQNVPYHSVDFLWGSQYLAKVWEGNPATLRQDALKLNKVAIPSPVLGFALDPTPLQNELAAITGVIAQYQPGLATGSTVDVEGEYAKFIAALDNAGMPKVINTVQQQLDDWRKTQK